jgi:iron complex transport system ATP-binding protein
MILSAKGIDVRLGDKHVLHGVSAVFEPAKITAIIGPNGAGKSTLMTALAGLRRPGSGQVLLGDTDMYTLAPEDRARRLGFLPQIPEVAWAVDARTLVSLGRTPFIGARGLTTADNAAVDRALSITATEHLAHRDVTTLSGGERARVLLARMLAGEPQWLLADEPLSGLDPGFQIDVADLFRRMAKDKGCGVIMTLHDLHMALRMADRVIILGDGKILADDVALAALSPESLARAYGVEARFLQGETGPVIEIVGRRV